MTKLMLQCLTAAILLARCSGFGARFQWFEDCTWEGREANKEYVDYVSVERKQGIKSTNIAKVIQKVKVAGALDCGRYAVLAQLVEYLREKHKDGCRSCSFVVEYTNTWHKNTHIEIVHQPDEEKDLYTYRVEVKILMGGPKAEYTVEVVPTNGWRSWLHITKKYVYEIMDNPSAMNFIRRCIKVVLENFFTVQGLLDNGEADNSKANSEL